MAGRERGDGDLWILIRRGVNFILHAFQSKVFFGLFFGRLIDCVVDSVRCCTLRLRGCQSSVYEIQHGEEGKQKERGKKMARMQGYIVVFGTHTDEIACQMLRLVNSL